MKISEEQLVKISPDASSLESAKALASIRRWKELSFSQNIFWGACKSGSLTFYKTQIDATGPYFKCNCPSRKNPCKHGLALLILATQNPEAFSKLDLLPEKLQAWQNNNTLPKKELTPEEQMALEAKRANQRTLTINKRKDSMSYGFADLESWLNDLIRQGLGATEFSDPAFWDSFASRMVDTKLRGISQKIKSLPQLQNGNTDWPEVMLAELGNLYLLAKGFSNIEDMPEDLQEQILLIAGVTQRKEEVLQEQGIKDQWSVIGQVEGDNIDRGKFRRTWVQGVATKRFALLLEYDYRNAGFPSYWPIGKMVNAELVYYPSTYPIRAIAKDKDYEGNFKPAQLTAHENLEEFLDHYAKALAKNPWLINFPMCLANVIIIFEKEIFFLIDHQSKKVPLRSHGNIGWKLMSISVDQPITVFGEWNGKMITPLGAMVNSRFIKIQ